MRYLFYTVDSSGEAQEVIGEREAINARTALAMLTPGHDPFDVYDPEEVECVLVQETLSGEDIQQGTV